MLNLGVPNPFEAAEPPKSLVLDWRGFGGVGYSEIKPDDARAIPRWVTYWEAAPELPETKPPRLIGDRREVASRSALDWGLRLMWRGSPRLIRDCREVASQSALDWGPWLPGEAVRAWLGTVAKWPVSPRSIGD
ncbi:hypothetical protein ACLB2K_036080 [Fragaria x ananassa]